VGCLSRLHIKVILRTSYGRSGIQCHASLVFGNAQVGAARAEKLRPTRKRDKVMLTLGEASQVIELLPENFDSHDFLRQYALCYTWSYLSLLMESGDVQQLHMNIGAFLINNISNLNISKIGEVTTANIFGKKTKCAQWGKVSKQ